MGLRLISKADRNLQPLALLDLGSSKVSCLIVAANDASSAEAHIGAALPARKLGYGHTRSRGIRAGTIIDLAEAEEAVKQAVAQAEGQAGLRVDEVVVAVTSGRIQSLNFSASTRAEGGIVTSADIDKMLAGGRAFAERDGRKLLHLQRLGFRIDGQYGVRNPRGMQGQQVSLELNAVTADDANLLNIRSMLGRSYLKVSSLVAAPYASALATLSEEDLQGRTVVIDLGAGTSTFAIFADGQFQHAGAIAVGGLQVSYEIARALSIPVIQAERIKTLYGNLMGAMSDEHEYVPLAHGGDTTEDAVRPTRAQLRRIVLPRVVEMLNLLAEKIAKSGAGGRRPDRLVLTGGASQLAGMAETAARHFGCPVRVSWPRAIAGLEPADASPGTAALLGLAFAVLIPGAIGRTADPKAVSPLGYAGRLGRWFKDSFWDDEQPIDAGSA